MNARGRPDAGTTTAERPHDPRVRHAMALMERHRGEPLSVAELARAVNLSPSYLTRLFRDAVGVPPAEYDRCRRLAQAHELVVTSFLSIKQIMATVGWTDPSHFSRDFKRQFGSSPKALRRRWCG